MAVVWEGLQGPRAVSIHFANTILTKIALGAGERRPGSTHSRSDALLLLCVVCL